MPEPTPFTLSPKPGIQRDGTVLDSTGYVDGQWVRFYGGRPKKMGGYREISADALGPVSGVYVWGRKEFFAIICGSKYGVEQFLVDGAGLGTTVIDRTPVGYVADDWKAWTFGSVYDDAVGGKKSLLVAHAAQTCDAIDDDTALPVYVGDIQGTEPLVEIPGSEVSGGFVAIAPYLVLFGSDGQLLWSDANDPTNLVTGDAGADRVAPFKIVRGLPIRSGGGPAALLWSLDSVMKMQWVGGTAIFRVDTLTTQSSILSPAGVIEYDGVYYWPGLDRFLMYDGAVRELVNTTNQNWFFDNLNVARRTQVWAMKFPRWGEIVWFYPRGDALNCTHAIVYNVRERTWYDFELSRTAGYPAQIFNYPVMVGEPSEERDSVGLTITPPVGVFDKGEIVQGTVTGARARVDRIISLPVDKLNAIPVGDVGFTVGEGLLGETSGATGTITKVETGQPLYDVWVHEYGMDRVTDERTLAIPSFFETNELGLATGGPAGETPQGSHQLTRIERIEPDFVQKGSMELTVVGNDYANSTERVSEAFVFDPTTEVIEPRLQYRQYRLRVKSDVQGGDYHMGRTLIHVAPGDGRV